MYLEFFKLWDEPFGVTPDPAYLYPSDTHLHALDSLRNGILGGRGFMTLIAEPGMGKTTLLYQLIEQLPQTTRSAYLFQTQCNSLEFMQYLLNEIGVDSNGMGLVAMHRRLNEMLFNEMVQGKQFVLIVDESQNLSNAVLETIRLLSNFETAHSKLMQIVLAGQSELANKLRQPDLSQLLQRITVMASLEAFSFEETAAYIRHRLKLAGHTGEDIFDPAALAAVYRRSKGIPRNINRICHAALSLAQAEQVHVVSSAMVEKSNRGLGPTVEELQRSRFAGQPHPAAPPSVKAPTQTTPQPVAPRVAPEQPQPPASAPTLTEPPPGQSTPPSAPTEPLPATSQPLPIPPQQFQPPLPDFVPPEPRRRSYGWLAWTTVFATLLILAALVAPANVRRALLQKLQPIVGSAASVKDPPQRPSAATDAIPTASAQVATPTSEPPKDIPKVDSTSKGLKIVIDPGHGGDDSGTRGPNGLLEKSVCLEVALRLGQLIEDELPGAQVVYTRSDDQNISPQHRDAIANESSADLFVSIHADSFGDGHGPQVYYLGGGSGKKSVGLASEREAAGFSLKLASEVQNALAQQFAPKGEAAPMRASGQPAFAVLNNLQAPAVVAEIPFSDESPLLDPTQRQQLAEALYRGIAAFLRAHADQTQR